MFLGGVLSSYKGAFLRLGGLSGASCGFQLRLEVIERNADGERCGFLSLDRHANVTGVSSSLWTC